MKAKDLKKISRPIDQIYSDISANNAIGSYKVFIPHFIHVDDATKLQLISDGFKVYIGNWSNVETNGLVIEW